MKWAQCGGVWMDMWSVRIILMTSRPTCSSLSTRHSTWPFYLINSLLFVIPANTVLSFMTLTSLLFQHDELTVQVLLSCCTEQCSSCDNWCAKGRIYIHGYLSHMAAAAGRKTTFTLHTDLLQICHITTTEVQQMRQQRVRLTGRWSLSDTLGTRWRR